MLFKHEGHEAHFEGHPRAGGDPFTHFLTFFWIPPRFSRGRE